MTTDTSPRRFTHFGAVFLGGAGLVPHGAHVMEMPAKLAYDAETYMLVTSTLYTGHVFAAHLTVFALVVTGLLTVILRKRGSPVWLLTAAGFGLFVLSALIWYFVAGPVLGEWRNVMDAGPGTAPQLYLELRGRFEFGHLGAFLAWLAGFAVLVYSLLMYRPAAPREPMR